LARRLTCISSILGLRRAIRPAKLYGNNSGSIKTVSLRNSLKNENRGLAEGVACSPKSDFAALYLRRSSDSGFHTVKDNTCWSGELTQIIDADQRARSGGNLESVPAKMKMTPTNQHSFLTDSRYTDYVSRHGVRARRVALRDVLAMRPIRYLQNGFKQPKI